MSAVPLPVGVLPDPLAACEPMIWQEARRIHSYDRAILLDDLLQEGRIAVIEALPAYDESRGALVPFMRQCVRRALVKFVWRFLPPVLVEHMRRVRIVTAELEQKLKRPPTIEEVAAAAHLTPKQVERVYGLSALLWSEPVDEIVGGLLDPASSHTFADVFVRNALLAAIRSLPPRDQHLLFLIYVEGRSFAEAAQELGTNENNARQIHDRILKKLRKALGGTYGLGV